MCFSITTEAYGYFWQCSISFTGYYNGKPYYILLDPNCSTPLYVDAPDLTFVVWNSTLSRWEVVSALSIGSIGSGTVCLTNNNPSNYPETSGIYSWIDAGPDAIGIAFSVQGTCPTPTPTTTLTSTTPTPTPTQTLTPTLTPTGSVPVVISDLDVYGVLDPALMVDDYSIYYFTNPTGLIFSQPYPIGYTWTHLGTVNFPQCPTNQLVGTLTSLNIGDYIYFQVRNSLGDMIYENVLGFPFLVNPCTNPSTVLYTQPFYYGGGSADIIIKVVSPENPIAAPV
jgi:hypothetical protein